MDKAKYKGKVGVIRLNDLLLSTGKTLFVKNKRMGHHDTSPSHKAEVAELLSDKEDFRSTT